MNRQKIILTINLLFTLMFILGYGQKVLACGCPVSVPPSYSTYHTIPLPVMVPPIPEFEHMWKAKDVVDSFEKNGLEVQKHISVPEEGNHETAIKKADEAVGFGLTSFGPDAEVFIHTFNLKNDLKEVQKYFLERNERGEFYTWSFVKDNVLLVLTGTVPENIARQYENVLYELK